MQADKCKQWSAALEDLYNCGYITRPQQLEGVAYAATPTIGTDRWDTIAYELASRLNGTLWPGAQGVTWVCGRDAPHGMLVNVNSLQDLKSAQNVLADMGCLPKLPWTRGRMARAALKWVCDLEKSSHRTSHIMEGAKYQYHSCKSGVYKGAKLYDVSSYHYRLLQWAPSLRVSVSPNLNVHWGPFSDHERGRFRDLLQGVEGDKLLRNSLVGCAMGGSGRTAAYMRGPGERFRADGSERYRWRADATAHCRMMELSPSPYRGVGLIIVRSAYELCAIAARETQSVYSTADSVCTIDGSKPRVWDDLGLLTRVIGEGDADIIKNGCWRVGLRETQTYRLAEARGKIPTMRRVDVPLENIPERLVYPFLIRSPRLI